MQRRSRRTIVVGRKLIDEDFRQWNGSYIGARLAPMLIARTHQVVGLHVGFYRDGRLYLDTLGMPVAPATRYKDLREVTSADFDGCATVIHRAELSNHPLGQNRPEITYMINHEGSVRLTNFAREAGVRRFVYASSFSVYGVAPRTCTVFPRCEVSAGPSSNDNRSYRVAFEKIESQQPGYKPCWTAQQGADELRRLFEGIEFSQDIFQFRPFMRLDY